MLSCIIRGDATLRTPVSGQGTSEVRPMAVLDRDGVINVDHGYVCTPDRFEWVEGATKAIRGLNQSDYRVVIATNQSGIGRGLFSEREFVTLMEWVAEELGRRGARFDACIYCPHHPTDGVGAFRVVCSCRKPQPGMLLKALEIFPTDVSRSFLIGDRESDIRAARSAGLRGLRFNGRPPIATLVESAVAECRI